MESNEVLKQGVGFKIAYQILITMFIVILIPIGDLWYNSVYLSRQNWEATISQNQLTNEQKQILQTILAEYIGPMATIISEDHLDSVPDLTSAIETLSSEIPSSEQAQKFRTQIEAKLI